MTDSVRIDLASIEDAPIIARMAGELLEVTAPQLPQFNRPLAFHEREGYSIAGGRKLKVVL